jgi:hypothetical protein
VNVETFLIFTYILSLIFRWRLQQKCDRSSLFYVGVKSNQSRSLGIIFYTSWESVLTLKDQKQQVIQI